jgi:HEAT repeat protein
MARVLLLATLTALILAAVPASAQEDPVIQGRPLSEWLEVLRGEKDSKARQVALLFVGAAGAQPVVWRPQTLYRRGSVLAVELAGPARSRQVLPALVAALREDPEEVVREAAANSLGRLAAKARDSDEGKRFAPVREGLTQALAVDKSGRVRAAAAGALGKLNPELARESVAVLAAALADPVSEVRGAAADSLRRLGKEAAPARSALEKLVQDRDADPLARVQAAQALGRIAEPASLPVLRDTLADVKAPTDLRVAAAEALAALGPSAADAVPLLASVLTADDSDVGVRRAAVAALDALGIEARPAIPALKKAVKDRDKFVRCLAMHALGRIGTGLGAEAKDVVTVLLGALEDNVIEVRVAAVETFGNLGPAALGADADAVRKRLEEVAKDPRKEIRDAALNALEKLKPG